MGTEQSTVEVEGREEGDVSGGVGCKAVYCWKHGRLRRKEGRWDWPSWSLAVDVRLHRV